MNHADVAAVRALATEAQHMASEAHRIAAAMREARKVEFHSTGATHYRERLSERSGRVDGTARELEQASRALVEHANQVEARMRQIESIERWFHDRVRDAKSVLHRAANATEDAADDFARRARADAESLVNAARRAPAPGSLDWETFQRQLR